MSKMNKGYEKIKKNKGSEKFFDMEKEPLTTRKKDYLKIIKVKTKGGYPRGTRKGDGGLAENINYQKLDDEETSQEEVSFPMLSDLDNPQGEDVEEDINKAGILRRVTGAHLVYKRQQGDGTYTEMWIFYTDPDLNVNNQKKRAILAGTDINSNTGTSPDGTQRYETWISGNAQVIQITGLPN